MPFFKRHSLPPSEIASFLNFKVFTESVADERVKWIEVAHNSNLRTSHNYILKSVAEIKGAFY